LPASAIGKALQDFLRHESGVLRPGEIGQHHRELVARNARDGVAGANRILQALCHFGEERVARGMAEAIVHELEAVQVDEQHREPRAVALRLHDHLREAVGE
jgi:hypothetical protein